MSQSPLLGARRVGMPAALAAVVGMAALMWPLRHFLQTDGAALVYLLLVGVLAQLGDFRVAATATAAALLAIAWLFVEPFGRFSIGDPRHVLTLAVFGLVGTALSLMAARLRRREMAALSRQRELAAVNHVSAQLITQGTPERMARVIAEEAAEVTGARRVVLFVPGGDGLEYTAAPEGVSPDAGETRAAEWVLRENKAVGLPEGRRADLQWPASASAQGVDGVVEGTAYLPLQTEDRVEAVLLVDLGPSRSMSTDEARLLVSLAAIVGSSLERQRLQAEADRASVLAETERLRCTLLSSVSHELKTPLAAVTATVSGLLEDDVEPSGEQYRQELRDIEGDLARLDAAIGDLVDLSRIESEAWLPVLVPTDVGEVMSAVAQRTSASSRGRLVFDVPADLPAVVADAEQLARALRRLTENALAYSSGPVRIGARESDGELVVWVEDEGPGVPEDERPHVFDKFFRGRVGLSTGAGTGLGLAVVGEIVAAHGGSIRVEGATPRGARFVVTLPTASGDGTDE